MNYVPGTASLIDDIDSKLERRVEGERCFSDKSFQDVASCLTQTGSKIQFVNVLMLVLSCREAPGAAPRWQNTDRLPQKH